MGPCLQEKVCLCMPLRATVYSICACHAAGAVTGEGGTTATGGKIGGLSDSFG